LLPAALLTCVVAMYNAFPLTYPDTGGYLDNARNLVAGRAPGFFNRPFTYSVFLIPFATRYTIWLVPVAQGVVVAFVVDLALRHAGVLLSTHRFITLFAILSVVSSLPWVSGQVMPDIFTSLVILLFFVTFWGSDLHSRRQRWIGSALLAFAIATHLSHIPLYGALLLVGLVSRMATGRDRALWHGMVHASAPLVVAAALLIAPNYLLHREPVLSRSSHLFYLAHLVHEGLAQRYLARACPTYRYLLCSDLSTLRADNDWFLWSQDGPWRRYEPESREGDTRFLREARAIVAGTMRQELPAVIGLSLRAAMIQLITLGPHPGEHSFSRSVDAAAERIGAGPSYRGSRQVQRTLALEEASFVQYIGVVLGLLLLLCCVPRLRGRAQRPLRLLIAMVCAGVVLNALVVASASMVHNRYQSRVVWLVPLLGIVAAMHILSERRPRSRS
jgi:hypothetical protein